MKKIFAAVIIAVMFCGTVYAERFTRFPAYGICTGNNVRCREEPGTNSRVIDHINKGHEVEVLSQRKVGGELWYEVVIAPDDEYDEAPVWVSARYITPEH